MKQNSLLFIITVVIFSCQDAKDKVTENITNSAIEKTLEQAGITTENIEKANENNAIVEVSFDSTPLFKDITDFKTVITAAGKQMLVFSITSEDARINVSFSGLEDMLEHKPLIGVYKEGKADPKMINGTVATIMMAQKDGFAYMLLDGEATITGFQADKVTLAFKGKAGNMLDANKPETWKPIEGKVICNYPAMSLIQVKAEDLNH